MAAERFSASIVDQLSLPGAKQTPQGYYRSKLFIAPFTTNPLVAAAGPLLSLLDRLCITPSLPPIHSIRENIEHELNAFYSRIQGKAYTEELDVIAYYLLCATIDELLGKNYLRVHGSTAEFKSFTPSSFDNVGPELRFFDIVNHLKERPNQYLDLIELAYYCLIAGFEGIQHHRADGRHVLDNLLEELYQLIEQHRVNKPQLLFKAPRKVEPSHKNNNYLVLISIISFLLLGTSYFISHRLLENQAKLVQYDHSVMIRQVT